jgi:hypothetical protein
MGRDVATASHWSATSQGRARFPLSQAAAALSFAKAGGYTGKVVVVRARNSQPSQ